MIYLVTNQKELCIEDRIYEIISVEESLSMLKELSVIGCDTETTSLSPIGGKIITLQFGCKKFQIVVDCTTVNIDNYKEILENPKQLKIFHNAKFDVKFLLKAGIVPENIWDTFLADNVLFNSDNYEWVSLEELVLRYCNYQLDKSARDSIIIGSFCNRFVKYAAEDVEYLEGVYSCQMLQAANDNCGVAINIENKYVIVLAYIENCGIYLDRNKWTKLYETNKYKLSESIETLNNWVIKNLPEFLDPQLDLFSPEKRKVNINWASSKQVIPIFKKLKLDIIVRDKKTGNIKTSIEATVISKYAEKNEFVRLYLEYKEVDKAITTYGLDFLKHINPITNRIHPDFIQLISSGRMACTNPNMQNIPRDTSFRECFTNSNEGTILVDADFSGQEQVVLANFCLEPRLLKFYDEGKTDMHSYIAKLCFPEELKDIPEEDVKKKEPELRYLAKTCGFSINYGGTGETIAKNANIPVERGNEVYNAYFKAFPDLKKYFDKVGKEAIKRGYVLISGKTGRRYYFDFFEEFTRIHNIVSQEGFWGYYRENKEENKSEVKNYFKYIGTIQRIANNYPIQGCSAEIVKISLVHFWEWLKQSGLINSILIINSIHDEIVLEVPVPFAQTAANILKECMEKAGKYYCNRVKLTATPVISNVWGH